MLVEIDSLGTLLEGKVSDLRETINLAVAERQAQGNTALAELNQLTDVLNLLEQNRKTVDRIYLQTLARGIYTLTQNQRDSLWEIAIQCPAEGGNAVYEARSLYGLGLGTAAFDDEQLCATEQRHAFSKQNTTQALAITLAPNPANDRVMILLPKVWTGKLFICPISGHQWKNKLGYYTNGRIK